jgi:hypothetical protein
VERRALSPPIRPRRKLGRRKVKQPYRPAWTGVYENWSRAWVDKNFWRVQRHFGGKEDAVQECAAIFAKCINRYQFSVIFPTYTKKGRDPTAAWFMSLYKRSVYNAWIRYAELDSADRALLIYEYETSPDMPPHPVTEWSWNNRPITPMVEYNAGPLSVKLWDLSDDLMRILSDMRAAPNDVLEFVFSGPRRLINRRLRRLYGVRDDGDLVQQIHDIESK